MAGAWLDGMEQWSGLLSCGEDTLKTVRGMQNRIPDLAGECGHERRTRDDRASRVGLLHAVPQNGIRMARQGAQCVAVPD